MSRIFVGVMLVLAALAAGCVSSDFRVTETKKNPDGTVTTTVTEGKRIGVVPSPVYALGAYSGYQYQPARLPMYFYKYTRPVRHDGRCPGINGQLREGDRYNCYYAE